MLKGYFHTFIHYPELKKKKKRIVGCGDCDHFRIEALVFSTGRQFLLQQVPWVKITAMAMKLS